MQITVDIPDELAAQVQARGLTPESYVRGLIEEAARAEMTASRSPRERMDIETFIRNMAANSDKFPALPDEAFTRESFYQDHD
jgi:hypothetical protein